MAEIKNTFLKGKMNQDLDPRIIPNGEYREARNLSISRSESSTVGEFENVLGNTAISTINAPIGTEVIGYFVDNNSNVAYLIATDWGPGDETRATSGASCYIIKVDLSASTAPTVLVQGYFLNFNKKFIITGINLIEDYLFWTDNLNQPRKINVKRAEANPNHYTNEDQISVAKYAPYEPILVMDRVQTTIVSPNPAVSTSTIVVSDSSGIKVGDIVTDKNKVTSQQITELVVVIGKSTSANTLTLSKSITVDNGTNIDFSRPSMTNKKNLYMSNHSSGAVTITGTGINRVYTIEPSSGTDVEWLYNGNNGVPKVGDLVSGPGVPSDTRVSYVEVLDNDNVVNPKQSISIKLNKETTTQDTDVISISDNPDYDAAWKGDESFLEDKFIRFSYRFKFEDNEYSLMAPFSQPMFIPKQYGQFGGGLTSPDEDMDNAYKSTIIAWFENNINNILLKIPMVSSTAQSVVNDLKITDVDILYKESDALAVKVLETISINTLPYPTFTSIAFNDAVNGDNIKYFLQHEYSSTKPYKTLPNNQTTRVYDKVPVKALAQEVIGNRIVYGNYLDRHTSPTSIAFSATANNKSINFDNYTQFPSHQLKQNRTYQVGFVLSDRYGRQSDVILSSYDSVSGVAGSTVFNPYNNITNQTSNPILDWLGNSINVTLNEAISSTYSAALGTPGIYSVNNPLGWYSYKIVVKQTEQEYYNVYLPGFVNGYPVTENNERNKSFFTTLLGDNINKIPRDLVEVGPNDRDYTSSESITIRVNNPLINNKPSPNPYPKLKAWNSQYYPGGTSQEVIQIATVRDMEVAAIPFKPDAPKGEYGESKILSVYEYENPPYGGAVSGINETPEPTGSTPWGTSGPDASLYNADSNLFVIRGDQSENINNPIGAYVTSFSVNADNNFPVGVPTTVLSMVPFLSVAETKPVESLLDIYWETSLSGNLVELNALVDSQYGGLIGSNFTESSFLENAIDTTVIGNSFNFTDGSGATVAATNVSINDLSITNGDGTVVDSDIFSVAINSSNNGFEIKPGTGQTFFYNSNVDTTNSGIYNITVSTTYVSGAGTFPDNIELPKIYLSNVAPTIDDCTNPTGITTATVDIKTFTGKNGSADTSVETQQLYWSLDPNQANFATISSQFEINSSTGVLSRKSTYSFVNNNTYNVDVIVTDVNGNGLSSSPCTSTFTVGAQHINAALCQGWQSGITTSCNASLQVQFLDSSNVSGNSSTTVSQPGGSTVTYPANSNSRTYNVFERNPNTTTGIPPVTVNHTTGALKQGTLYITPVLENYGSSIGGDVSVSFTIQRKPIGSGSWNQAIDSSGFTVYNETLTTGDNSSVSIKKVFDIPGEYRVLTTAISGDLCSPVTGTTTLIVNFGDDVYDGDCANAPA